MTNRPATALFATALFTASFLGTITLPAYAQENIMSEKNVATIIVSGEGEVQTAPDMAILDLTVLREAKTAREAMTENNKAMSQVLNAMKEAGIAERDLQTSGINIQPNYTYPNEKNELKAPQIVGYNVSNGLTVRVRDLDKVGSLLDKSIDLGVNQGGGLRFINDEPAALLMEARKRAIADALLKAKVLTEAAGVKTGRILEINEVSNSPHPMPMYRSKMVAMAADMPESVPVSAGENSYNISVTVKFEIDQ